MNNGMMTSTKRPSWIVANKHVQCILETTVITTSYTEEKVVHAQDFGKR